ncbi:S-layer homology domain-containing protein [Candidatus Peregrinibacteria bacterium]|nr:S-layer homology domain-containing protein [Candidatus Peregrinibacteria bacterium]
MKKFLNIIIALALVCQSSISAFAVDMTGWYMYRNSSPLHSFSIKYPTTWQLYTEGDDLQGFALQEDKNNEEYIFTIQEFDGLDFENVINYFKNNNSLLTVEDIIFPTVREDIPAKKVSYVDGVKTFIKRGNTIIAFSRINEEYNEVIDAMESSLSFTDNWHQYINLRDKYAFIFPVNFSIENTGSGIEISDSGSIFTIEKYPNIALDDAPAQADIPSAVFISMKNIVFHSMPAIEALYQDKLTDENFSRIFVQNGNDSFSLTDTNIGDDFPVSNYYYDYIVEMLESFEFFEIDAEDYQPYIYFPDIRENHVNAKAINSLYEQKVINGYPDGRFLPDGEINRAELTKMMVATVADPNSGKYKNCFPDVNEEWFARYVCYAKEKGWVEGYQDGTFKPANNINRVEAIKIILEGIFDGGVPSAPGPKPVEFDDVNSQEWYWEYFNFAGTNDLLDTQHVRDSKFLPNKNMTRKEVAEMIYRTDTAY